MGEGLEEEVHPATVGGVGPEHERLAGDPQAVGHARLMAGERLDLPHDRRRTLHARPVGERHLNDQIALVLLGDEADGGFREQPPGESEQGDEHQEDRDTDPQRQSDEGRIGRRDHGEEPIESPEQPTEQQPQEPIDRIGGGALRLEEQRRERGAQSERVDGRQDRRHGNGEGELAEELPHDPGDEPARDEHRTEHKRDADDRPGDLLHRLHRRRPR